MFEKRFDLGWRGRVCVIEDVLFCYDYLGKIRGYDFKERVWREVRGVELFFKFFCGVIMVNRGGKFVVLWEGKVGSGGVRRMEIWCVEIEVERCGEGEIWGKILWFDIVFMVFDKFVIVNCLVVIV